MEHDPRIESLIIAGGESLHPTLSDAEHIATIYGADHLIATGAIKSGEICYVAVDASHRGRGLAKQIVCELCVAHPGELRAHTRLANVAMHRVLESCGFERAGDPWTSDAHPGELIVTWRFKA